MNDSKYKQRGKTHRNGITATSWQIWLVVAKSIIEALAAKVSHNRRCPQEGAVRSSPIAGWERGWQSASNGLVGSVEPLAARAQNAQEMRKAKYAKDHNAPCTLRGSRGSTKKG